MGNNVLSKEQFVYSVHVKLVVGPCDRHASQRVLCEPDLSVPFLATGESIRIETLIAAFEGADILQEWLDADLEMVTWPERPVGSPVELPRGSVWQLWGRTREHFVAMRRMERLDRPLTCRSLAAGARLEVESLCSWCGNRLIGSQRRLCRGCRVAVYCSHDCQRQHWRDHRSTCGR